MKSAELDAHLGVGVDFLVKSPPPVFGWLRAMFLIFGVELEIRR